MERRVIPGFSSYSISEDGNVIRLTDGRRFKAGYEMRPVDREGYFYLALVNDDGVRKGHFLHYYVAITFLGPRPTPKHEVAHNDGTRKNNHFTNLRWATRKENHHDMKIHGTSVAGERNGRMKVTDKQVEEIRSILKPRPGMKRLRRGMVSKLAKKYGVCTATITNLALRRYR